jgi:hypothetical protein
MMQTWNFHFWLMCFCDDLLFLMIHFDNCLIYIHKKIFNINIYLTNFFFSITSICREKYKHFRNMIFNRSFCWFEFNPKNPLFECLLFRDDWFSIIAKCVEKDLKYGGWMWVIVGVFLNFGISNFRTIFEDYFFNEISCLI